MDCKDEPSLKGNLHSLDIDKIRITDAVKRSRFGGPFYLLGFAASAGYSESVKSHPDTTGIFVALFLVLLLYRVVLAISLANNKKVKPNVYLFSIWAIYISSALVWASSVIWLFYINPAIDLTVVITLICSAGIITGGAAALVAYKHLLAIYCALMCFPLVLSSIFLMSGPGNVIIALLIGAYSLFVLLVGLQQSDSYMQALNDNLALSLQAKELEKAKTDAERAGQAKADFLAAMTHEIRTPMNGVLGMAQLLAMSDLNEEQRQQVDVISNAGISLLHVIDNILDYSKINAGKLLLSNQVFDPQKIVNELLRLFKNDVDKKGIKLSSSMLSPPRMVEGDRYRIHQVLSNLIGNAIKFTDSGQITIKSWSEMDPSNGMCNVCFSVTDTGIGIAPKDQEQIFEQFYQVSQFKPDIRGTGLGLSITKQLVELMSGTIELDSEVGAGTTFKVVFPLVAISNQAPIDRSSGVVDLATELSDGAEESLSVLLVEDNLTNQLICKTMLEKMGCVVDVVESGHDAVDKFKGAQYAMVFLDCNLPEMDGFDVARSIRKLEVENGAGLTPIVALTAHVHDNVKQQCIESGMTDFLSKPFLFEDLKKHVDNVKSNRQVNN